MPGLELLEVEGVGQRQHRQAVLNGREAFDELLGDALRGRIRAHELGVVRLDRAQAAHELVVLGVADLGLGLDVVEVVVAGDLEAQLFGLDLGVLDVLDVAGHLGPSVLRLGSRNQNLNGTIFRAHGRFG